MKIIDLSLKRETENYKFFYIQYTVWYQPNKIKQRHGFVIKSSSDCHWSDTGRRLSARLEIAVLAELESKEQ